MQQIGKFSLQNEGGFVVKLQFQYIDNNGDKVHVDGTGGIPLGQTKSADPGDYGVPDGSPVQLYAFVVWGKDNVGSQLFYYSKGSPWTANYTISGTTLDNQLGFTGLSQS
jgi:hypothetical protein